MAVILIDCMAAIPWAGWSLARAGITKVENAKKTPATSPQPSAAKSFNEESEEFVNVIILSAEVLPRRKKRAKICDRNNHFTPQPIERFGYEHWQSIVPNYYCRKMDEVIITEYNPNWVLSFKQESACIRAVLDIDIVTRIEHFGSTAVPGLAAKPIVDILIGVRSLAEAKQVAVSPLEQLGYAYWLENPDPQRMFFVKGLLPNSPRTHHIHMVEPDSVLWERLIFRDYLCKHPDEAARYAQLKYDLAQRFSSDREAYTAGKAEYINSVMQKARQQPTS